jgi:hypothetical protein
VLGEAEDGCLEPGLRQGENRAAALEVTLEARRREADSGELEVPFDE